MNLRVETKDLPKPGVKVRITWPYNTQGKIGIISYFDTRAKKWKVNFPNGWVGWYKRMEFEITGELPSGQGT